MRNEEEGKVRPRKKNIKQKTKNKKPKRNDNKEGKLLSLEKNLHQLNGLQDVPEGQEKSSQVIVVLRLLVR